MKKTDMRKKNASPPLASPRPATPAESSRPGTSVSGVRPAIPAASAHTSPPVAGTRPSAAVPPVIAASTRQSPVPIARPTAPTASAPSSASAAISSRPPPPVVSSPAPSTGKPLLPARPSGAPQAQVVHFEFQHPGARSVCLAGSFNNWQPEGTAMAAVGSGKWVKDLPLLPGTYEYRLVVDGQWMEDPQAKKSAPNPFGTWNSVLMVPSAA